MDLPRTLRAGASNNSQTRGVIEGMRQVVIRRGMAATQRGHFVIGSLVSILRKDIVLQVGTCIIYQTI